MKIRATATGTIANRISPDYYRNQSRACLYATSRGWEVGCAEFRQRGRLQGKFHRDIRGGEKSVSAMVAGRSRQNALNLR
jgi:hypothetical protein